MTHSSFHIRRHDVLEQDLEGAEFNALDEAYEEGCNAVTEILAGMLLADDVVDGSCFEITTEDGIVVREVPFKSVIRFT
ncbi:hypothetical protein [Rhizobium sp. NFR03]|uniref:DUF6894 family protein n=1 Tax=Rhizobium sp. NFR03 TaxID=1566263 RepID=UPI0008AF3207|nr:hypothetical protein [Rhizobium sp. NFR03]SES41188.1 hypothetical protein SAMN03159406_04135 [Rhizobium sp. NFR03]